MAPVLLPDGTLQPCPTVELMLAQTLAARHKPRLILYAQTHHTHSGTPISLLPLLDTGLTHLNIAAVHLNHSPTPHITLNNDPPSHDKFATLWSEVATLQRSKIPVLAMLGGAAKGSYALLAQDFDLYYSLLSDFISTHKLDGIDLDVEEPTSLYTIIRLIDALHSDFGKDFLITMSPVLTALIPGQQHLSGFNYRILDAMRGKDIAWYNAQLYNGWGDASAPLHYQLAVAGGWDPRRIVLGQLTSPNNGHGFVPLPRLADTVSRLRTWCAGFPGIEGEGFGGVMGWEFFNSSPGGEDRPWEWASTVGSWFAVPLGQVESEVDIPGEKRERKSWGETIISALTSLGFTRSQAVAGLDIANGNVERAAGWLFEQ